MNQVEQDHMGNWQSVRHGCNCDGCIEYHHWLRSTKKIDRPFVGTAQKGGADFLFCSEKCAEQFGSDCHLRGYWKFGAEPFFGSVADTHGEGAICDNCDEVVT